MVLRIYRVYAKDEFENMGISVIAFFAKEEPEPFPTIPVAVASLAAVAIVIAGLLMCFRKPKRQAKFRYRLFAPLYFPFSNSVFASV